MNASTFSTLFPTAKEFIPRQQSTIDAEQGKGSQRCRFFGTASGCRAGDQCRFFHAGTKGWGVEGGKERRDGSGRGRERGAIVERDVQDTTSEGLNILIVGREEGNIGVVRVDDRKQDVENVFNPRRRSFARGRGRFARRGRRGKNAISKDGESGASAHRNVVEEALKSTTDQTSKSSSSASPTKPATSKPITQPTTSRKPVHRPHPRSLTALLSSTTDPLKRAHLTRTLDLQQLERRFRSTYKILSHTPTHQTSLISLQPTDPDFPYSLIDNLLHLQITIPSTYPIIPATIVVLNEEIPLPLRKGVEKAWMRKTTASKVGLLAMVNWLDRELEGLLGRVEEVGRITFVRNTGNKPVVEGNNVEMENKKVEVEMEGGYYGERVQEDDTLSELSSDYENNPRIDENVTDETLSPATENIDAAINTITLEERVSTYLSTLPTPTPSHRGTQVRPTLTLQNISLLTCTSLSLHLRCTRCKTPFDIPSLTTTPHWTSCPQCKTTIGVHYRPHPLHLGQDIPSIGYLDLDGCAVTDLLPSTYIPTCSKCTNPSHIFKSLPVGSTLTHHCTTPSCHTKLLLGIDAVRFVSLAPSTLPSRPTPPKSKKPTKKDSALTPGTPLPKTGLCPHYRKSYRWFRFSCCGKLYPCDTCHQTSNSDNHEMVWATRMVCGHCSHEQPYRKDGDCSHCKRELTRKLGGEGGFWEGGKGMRDKVRMSRKEGRKFKGFGKTKCMKGSRVGKKA